MYHWLRESMSDHMNNNQEKESVNVKKILTVPIVQPQDLNNMRVNMTLVEKKCLLTFSV